MKIKLPFIILVCGVFYSANLGALSLVDKVKQSGLASLPKNQKEVDDILKQNGVKASPFSIENQSLVKTLF